ncbi:MAG TPA: xanthine dehydrogenase family protein molybdopterin-binding subunit [Actinospica sp.]|jgi:xanthine dehydrogenase YagR molybdenum-binding subunit|nr:xanthine dehydrogenase family protein molybdopterin-binding subunit [Actinospica sp.]
MSTSPIGSSTSRVDGVLKVTGGAKYAADNMLTNMAYGYLVTSTVGKGTISAMTTSGALASPGVLAVYTPFNPLKLYAYGGDENDEFTPPLQDKNVRYRGQVIGMVVAETFEQARDAAALVTATYSTQTPVTAMAKSASGSGTVSEVYNTSIVHHHAMEPHATVASWSGTHLTIYTATQGTPLVVSRLSHALGVSSANIHVVNPYVGGAFGGKWGNWAHTPLTAAAAQALGRPVKTVLTREQVFTVVGHRPNTSQTVSLTANSSGTISALKHIATVSKSNSSNFTENPASVSKSTYAAGSISTAQTPVSMDIPATTIMRAPGEANGSFALESAIDELAVALNMDPLALRQKNYAKTVPGGSTPWSSKHLAECYTTGAGAFGWSQRSAKPGQVTNGDWLVGLGMATAAYPAGRSASTLMVRLQNDGTAVVSGTGSDAGTGQATVFAILGAAALGIPVAQVSAELGDSTLPTAANAGGSGSTSSNGTAVNVAAQAAISALIQLAISNTSSPFHGKSASSVTYKNGNLTSGSTTISFGALLTKINVAGVQATGTSAKNTTSGYGFMSFGAIFCEVQVNKWTAEPRVTRLLAVMDAGTIVDAKTARSQIMGGMIMGIGQALLEGTILESDGRFANANLASYLVPVNADLPHIDVTFLNYPDTILNPIGMRGIGELGIVGAAGAVANAIYNATGKRVRDLPITLDKLL